MNLINSLIFLSSGLFLGWSMGANDASNVFGTAVATRMVRFSTAAFLCSVFVILGAVRDGAGAAGGLSQLGAINTLPGSFTAALAAALTIAGLSKLGLPGSTTQAVVGAIIGWNLFSGSITNLATLRRILMTWIASPVLGGIFAILIYSLVVLLIRKTKPHLLVLDRNIRFGLILAGVFGSYAIGANGIGNVMGFFVAASPFVDLKLGTISFSAVEQLFLLGGIAIAVGVYTYSQRVMMTVGNSLMALSPLGALVVVIAHSLVLFIFSSQELANLLISVGLPPIPLLPVSGSQAVIGAVLGIGLLQGLKGVRQIKWGVLVGIASGWVTTPIIAAIVGFTLLFIVQNVFGQEVYREIYYNLSPPVLERLAQAGISTEPLADLQNQTMAKGIYFRQSVRDRLTLSPAQEALVLNSAEVNNLQITPEKIATLDQGILNPVQIAALNNLVGQSFSHKWQLDQALAQQSDAWQKKDDNPQNEDFNQKLKQQLAYVQNVFHH
jgi:PiT family inorganic phosphate transporter